MAYPNDSLLRRRPDLAETLFEMDLDDLTRRFVAPQIFPFKTVDLQAGTYGRLKAGELTREPIEAGRGAAASQDGTELRRAPTGTYTRDEVQFQEDSWKTEENGIEERIDEREKNAFRSYFDHEVVATARARYRVMLAQEKRVVALMHASSNTTPAGAGQDFTDPTNWDSATPVAVIETAVQAFFDRTGLYPNALSMSMKQFRGLRNTDEVVSRISSSGAGDKSTARRVTIAQLQEVFDIENIIIGDSIRNSAAPSTARADGTSYTPVEVWGNQYLRLFHRADTDDLRVPQYGRIFHWGDDGSMEEGLVESYFSPEARSDFIRVRHDTHEKEVYPELLELIDITQ